MSVKLAAIFPKLHQTSSKILQRFATKVSEFPAQYFRRYYSFSLVLFPLYPIDPEQESINLAV